jgi:PAS domain S-box-containing protein
MDGPASHGSEHLTDQPTGPLRYVVRTFDAVTLEEVGNWGWDVGSDTIYFSPEIRRLLGYTESDFGGTVDGGIATYIDPDERPRVGAEFAAAAAAAAPFAVEATLIRPDGVKLRLLARGQPVFSVPADPLTPAVRPNAANERARRRLAYIEAESPIFIGILDLSFRYVHVNSAVTEFTGLTVATMVGRRPSEIIPVTGQIVEAMAREAFTAGRTVRQDVGIERDGHPRVVEAIVFVLHDDDGAPVEICSMAVDVTEVRLHEVSTRARRETTDLIISALSEDRLVAMRQPVVDINGERTVSDELLVRLILPNGTVLQPADFLPGAERFELIQEIDLWMLHQALELAELRPAQVNLSAVTFSDRDACAQIVAALRDSLQVAPRVIFEITETAAVHHLDAACEFAEQLAALGCSLALDDFGTGFGSFTYLRRLPLRYLKIDQSFVTGLAGSEGDRKVVSSIISIAEQFELITIAEGVEDAETLTVLGDLGADYAQGFHLGRPEPVAA